MNSPSKLRIHHNASVAQLIEIAIREEGCKLTPSGALVAYSGEKTGRSPKDKRIVFEEETKDIWWGNVNMKMSLDVFEHYSSAADSYLYSPYRNGNLFIVDAYCGWDSRFQLKVRLYCTSAYHALFMRNMLIPSKEKFEKPDFVIKNVGQLRLPAGADSSLRDTLVGLCFSRQEALIFGTRYAGEMKKLVLTLMMYRMPIENQLCLHSSANIDVEQNKLTVFFGLSGTGKTTLSADPRRQLIGDDEHVWTDTGVFNIEGGCYAKCIDLSAEKEPDIFQALRFGSILENVVLNPENQEPDYSDASITENTRGAYPLHFIQNARIPALAGLHPNHIVFLTCDTFGLLPPLSRLSLDQAVDFFIAGYTSKTAGTEVGIKTPQAVFSACFGEPFLVWQPARYGELLRQRLQDHNSQVWLLNTGWINGSYGQGQRISIRHSRALLDAIHSGEISQGQFDKLDIFDIEIPTHCTALEDSSILDPRKVWPQGVEDYLVNLQKLKFQFDHNLSVKKGLIEENHIGPLIG